MRTPPFGVLLVLVALAAGLAALAGLGARGAEATRTTGDEPHYLVTALAIADRGSLDVLPEYREETYRPFHEAGLIPQGVEEDGRMLEPHDPLLPALLALPVALGGWVLAKIALALVAAAVAALTLWLAVRRLGAPAGPAAAVVGVLGASAPLAAYGAQVYPELPAALAVLAAVIGLTGARRPGEVALVCAAVVALPWLAVKYAPVAAVLAALLLWGLLRDRRRAAAGAAAGALVAGGLVFAALHLRWYGGLTPYAAGTHFEEGQLTVVGHEPDYVGRAVRLSGLLVDDRFGIALWQPAWLLAVPAFGALLAVRPRGWQAVVAPLAAGWLTATFVALTMQGWWFPGRQIVVVLPLAAAVLAWWAPRGAGRLAATLGLGAVGVVTYLWLAVDGSRGTLAWAVDLTETGNPVIPLWRLALPDYLQPDAATWPLHAAWSVALLAAGVAGWAAARPRRAPAPSPGHATEAGLSP